MSQQAPAARTARAVTPLASMGFVRAAAVAPELRVADVEFNTASVIAALQSAAEDGCHLAVFPELCLTSYTCADLFYQATLRAAAVEAVFTVAQATGDLEITAVVGLPLEVGGRLFNVAALVGGGRVHGLVPKTYLPSRNEFYEERWFTSGRGAAVADVVLNSTIVPFGTDLLFQLDEVPGCSIGIEICEDLWAVQPPSGDLALAGATIIANPSASNELLGKPDYRRDLVRQQSARCQAAYVYAGAGPGESTTDLVYAGHCMIAEYGTLLAESERFSFGTETITADVDVQRLTHERLKSSVFSFGKPATSCRVIPVVPSSGARRVVAELPLRRPVSRLPFVPEDARRRDEHCREIFAIQSTGLAKRLQHVGSTRAVLGLSGGLDSTLALLVTMRAFAVLGEPTPNIVCLVMPGLGTSKRTHANAMLLAAAVGATVREIPIHAAVLQHFADIGHDPALHDVTYENSQARERTQLLMDVANQVGGLVIGTGDLSELALGWCTFNGDHMSMYHVNAGVPKTLVRHLVEWCADNEFGGAVSDILRDICATPITPELLPLGDGGVLVHETEAVVGPYVLHDFFLYYAIRHSFGPRKVFHLASGAFRGEYDPETVLRWLREFYRRFFTQQFKRSAMPDGPKVGSVALSPRGDWRMPSDASVAVWMGEIAELEAGMATAQRRHIELLSAG